MTIYKNVSISSFSSKSHSLQRAHIFHGPQISFFWWLFCTLQRLEFQVRLLSRGRRWSQTTFALSFFVSCSLLWSVRPTSSLRRRGPSGRRPGGGGRWWKRGRSGGWEEPASPLHAAARWWRISPLTGAVLGSGTHTGLHAFSAVRAPILGLPFRALAGVAHGFLFWISVFTFILRSISPLECSSLRLGPSKSYLSLQAQRTAFFPRHFVFISNLALSVF